MGRIRKLKRWKNRTTLVNIAKSLIRTGISFYRIRWDVYLCNWSKAMSVWIRWLRVSWRNRICYKEKHRQLNRPILWSCATTIDNPIKKWIQMKNRSIFMSHNCIEKSMEEFSKMIDDGHTSPHNWKYVITMEIWAQLTIKIQNTRNRKPNR